jgi:drug/metabolite transporter (DMT)-like permease
MYPSAVSLSKADRLTKPRFPEYSESIMERLGELAAFGTAVCYTASALFFEQASRRTGAQAVNFYKVVCAFFLLALSGLVLRGMPLPLDAPKTAWIYLPLSGLIGFVIADYFLFNAYILIGSRLTVLFQPLSPLFTALLGFVILGERMKPAALVAMGLVVAGIAVVLASRGAARRGEESRARRSPVIFKGIVFALLSVFFNALGLVFSKKGLSTGYDAVLGTEIRVITAILGFGIQSLLIGQAKVVFVDAPKDRTAMAHTAIGSVFGPFLGVTMSLFALQHASAGAASTLMALTPVIIIVPAIFIQKQKIRPGEIIGAIMAVAGAALFFLF